MWPAAVAVAESPFYVILAGVISHFQANMSRGLTTPWRAEASVWPAILLTNGQKNPYRALALMCGSDTENNLECKALRF